MAFMRTTPLKHNVELLTAPKKPKKEELSAQRSELRAQSVTVAGVCSLEVVVEMFLFVID